MESGRARRRGEWYRPVMPATDSVPPGEAREPRNLICFLCSLHLFNAQNRFRFSLALLRRIDFVGQITTSNLGILSVVIFTHTHASGNRPLSIIIGRRFWRSGELGFHSPGIIVYFGSTFSHVSFLFLSCSALLDCSSAYTFSSHSARRNKKSKGRCN